MKIKSNLEYPNLKKKRTRRTVRYERWPPREKNSHNTRPHHKQKKRGTEKTENKKIPHKKK